MTTLTTTQSLLSGYNITEKRTRRTERGDLISQFLEKINPSRIEAGYDPLTFGRIARMLKSAKIPESYLYTFYQECSHANDFCKYFWWRLKQK